MSLSTENVQITTSKARKMGAYLARPSAPGRLPAVIVFMEIFGVNDHIRDVTAASPPRATWDGATASLRRAGRRRVRRRSPRRAVPARELLGGVHVEPCEPRRPCRRASPSVADPPDRDR